MIAPNRAREKPLGIDVVLLCPAIGSSSRKSPKWSSLNATALSVFLRRRGQRKRHADGSVAPDDVGMLRK